MISDLCGSNSLTVVEFAGIFNLLIGVLYLKY